MSPESPQAVRHTPIPWRAKRDDEGWWNVIGHDSALICELWGQENSADAAFIVRVVNCHEELLQALKLWDEGCRNGLNLPDCQCYGCITSRAIAKAEGRS